MLEKLERAREARLRFLRGGTDALRLVDGRGSGLEGIEIDDYAGRWLVQTREQGFPEWLRAITDPTARAQPPWPRAIYWKQLGEQKAAPAWVAGEEVREPFVVKEHGDLHFWIDFTAGYSQGLFLDQRENRLETLRRARGLRVLNCFAYTCGFGVAAALGGAAGTVNVDLSKRYLEWGKRNYELNGIAGPAHEFIHGDALNWLERFARKGRRFDLVILDPPTFSRDKEGRVFTVEEGFSSLVRAAEAVLTPAGGLFCSTNQRTLAPGAFRKLITRGLAHPGSWRIEDRAMPPDFTGEQYLKACWVHWVGRR